GIGVFMALLQVGVVIVAARWMSANALLKAPFSERRRKVDSRKGDCLPGDRPMTPRKPRYAGDEHFLRGDDIYQQIRPQVEGRPNGKFVAIDIDSGAFEVAASPDAARQRLLERL